MAVDESISVHDEFPTQLLKADCSDVNCVPISPSNTSMLTLLHCNIEFDATWLLMLGRHSVSITLQADALMVGAQCCHLLNATPLTLHLRIQDGEE